MASVCCPGFFDIDYSIVDGRIRRFELKGKLLYDETRKIETPLWKEQLIEVVKQMSLDQDDGHGLHAFVESLMAQNKGQGNGFKH